MEYSEDVVKTAIKINQTLSEEDRNKLVMKAIKRRLLKEQGIDLTKFTVEDVYIELMKKIDNLQAQIDILKQKKLTKKQLIKIIIKAGYLTHKQERLLKFLADCKPKSNTEIMKYVGIKDHKTDNLRALVRETRHRIKKYGGEDMLIITPLRTKPGGYQLTIKYPYLK